MRRLVPVWWILQNAVLKVLPLNEWGTRLLPSFCGALSVVLAFLWATRAHGLWFGWSLLVLMGGNQTLLWLSQHNRFYALALLWSTLTFLFIWTSDVRRRFDILTAFCAGAAILSHNLTLVLFALGAGAAIVSWSIGAMPWAATRRAVVAGACGVGLYFLYLRPLLSGWVAGGTGGTLPIVSFVAQVGTVPLALSVVGCFTLFSKTKRQFLPWWGALFVSSLAFLTIVPWMLDAWNPRYALLFMPPAWVLGSAGAALIAEEFSTRRLAPVWIFTVLLLVLPKIASHYMDGSRHDFRTAATIVAGRPLTATVLSNWPAELQYYLQPVNGQAVRYWEPGLLVPEGETVIVLATNAWERVVHLAERRVEVIGQVGRRRFDEQSHLIRIYVVSAVHGSGAPIGTNQRGSSGAEEEKRPLK
jgi:hypothetical protein